MIDENQNWEPEQGDMIEVSDDGDDWTECEFIAISKDKFIAWDDGIPQAWLLARPLQPKEPETDYLAMYEEKKDAAICSDMNLITSPGELYQMFKAKLEDEARGKEKV